MEKKWNYVEKDGNPTVAGQYWVTLVYPEVKKVGAGYSEDDWKETGKVFGSLEERFFMDAKDAGNWIMEDQPKEGLVWTEQSGSHMHERVHAWMPMEDIEIAEVPEGVEIKN